jgi:hypothetical protein
VIFVSILLTQILKTLNEIKIGLDSATDGSALKKRPPPIMGNLDIAGSGDRARRNIHLLRATRWNDFLTSMNPERAVCTLWTGS